MSDRSSTLTPPPPMLAPSGTYVTGNEHLLVSSLASVASVLVIVSGRVLTAAGAAIPFVQEHRANSDRTVATNVIRLPAGWLTDITAIVAGAAPQFGQAFVRVDLVRGENGARTVLATFLQGMLSATQRIAWPGSAIETTLDTPGALRSVAGTNPAAGVEINEAVPAGARWRIRALRFQLVTDATAANREVNVYFDDGTTPYFGAPSGVNQAASLTRFYNATPSGLRGAGATSNEITVAIPDVILPAGHRVNTLTTNLQAGDNFGAPQLFVEEWLEGL